MGKKIDCFDSLQLNAVRLPEFGNYGNYTSDNYGAHTLWFEFGDMTIYFSYQTIVAFNCPEYGLVVSTNIWSRATGKHLTWIDKGDKDNRVPHDVFVSTLKQAMSRRGIKNDCVS